MNKRYIKDASAIGPFVEVDKQMLKDLRSSFPAMLSRRLSLSSLMIGHLIRDTQMGAEDELYYLSTYSTTTYLEKYLESFPNASPYYFQSSIHPGSVEMVIVSRKMPLKGVYPLSGDKYLAAQGLMTALCSDAETVHIIGAEEVGTWLTESGLGSEHAYAYHLCLTRNGAESIGEVSYHAESSADEQYTHKDATRNLHKSIQERETSNFILPEKGSILMSWDNEAHKTLA